MPEVIADWQDPDAFPEAGTATMLARWHWEFLRRNAGYQSDYHRFQALSDDAGARHAIARKYGLDGIMLDYRDPLESLFRSGRDPGAIRTVQWETAWTEDARGVRHETPLDDAGYLDPRIRQHEVCVVFNLRHGTDGQLQRAQEYLRRQQRRFAEKRGEMAHYPRLLRLLDADAAGVPLDEVAARLFPDQHPRLARRRVEEDLERARRLRDTDYRFL